MPEKSGAVARGQRTLSGWEHSSNKLIPLGYRKELFK